MPLAASPASYSRLAGSHLLPRPLTVGLRAPTFFPGLLRSARGLPLSSPASHSPPDSFLCLSTYSYLLDDLPKPGQFITICPTHSHAFRTPIHPASYHYQTPPSMRPHHCHILPSSRPDFPAPLRFSPPMSSFSAGLFDVAKLFPFCPKIVSDVPAGLSIR